MARRRTRSRTSGQGARMVIKPGLDREIASHPAVKQFLDIAGGQLAGEMDDETRTAVAATRARKLAAGETRPYLSTGRLAGSWSHRVVKGPKGWVLLLGSGAGPGAQPVEYAVPYLWGYDPTGPRGHYQWAGNDVFETVLRRHRIKYNPPF